MSKTTALTASAETTADESQIKHRVDIVIPRAVNTARLKDGFEGEGRAGRGYLDQFGQRYDALRPTMK